MRAELIIKEYYTFNELNDDAKEKAREWYRSINDDCDWHECVFDDVKRAASIMGIDIDDIYFSGFSNQGAGACVTGAYEYNAGALPAIMREYPKDKELQDIARNLQTLQRAWFYQLTATMRHFGRYYHEYSVYIDVQADDDVTGYGRDVRPAEESLAEYLREFMQWVYARLEAQYDWIMSDEQVDESITCNGYEFTSEGELA